MKMLTTVNGFVKNQLPAKRFIQTEENLKTRNQDRYLFCGLHAYYTGFKDIDEKRVSLFINYSRLPLSRSRRDPLKHFEISVLRHIRCAELRKIPKKKKKKNKFDK